MNSKKQIAYLDRWTPWFLFLPAAVVLTYGFISEYHQFNEYSQIEGLFYKVFLLGIILFTYGLWWWSTNLRIEWNQDQLIHYGNLRRTDRVNLNSLTKVHARGKNGGVYVLVEDAEGNKVDFRHHTQRREVWGPMLLEAGDRCGVKMTKGTRQALGERRKKIKNED